MQHGQTQASANVCIHLDTCGHGAVPVRCTQVEGTENLIKIKTLGSCCLHSTSSASDVVVTSTGVLVYFMSSERQGRRSVKQERRTPALVVTQLLLRKTQRLTLRSCHLHSESSDSVRRCCILDENLSFFCTQPQLLHRKAMASSQLCSFRINHGLFAQQAPNSLNT
jgi:hypothetical protein